MKPVKSATTIRTLENGQISATMFYRPTDVGFVTAGHALDNAAFALAKSGVAKDQLKLYTRKGDRWVETTEKLAKARADLRAAIIEKGGEVPPKLKDDEFAVGLDYVYDFKPEDVKDFDLLETGRLFGNKYLPLNVADRAFAGLSRLRQGSVTQHLFDASSVLDPRFVESASSAINRGVRIRKIYVEEL